MKKLTIIMAIILIFEGCSALTTIKNNFVKEAKGYNLSLVKEDVGIIYVEKGKYFYKKDINSIPKQIDIKDIGKYTVDIIKK